MNKDIIVYAGPCAVETSSQLDEICSCISDLGLSWLRAGVYKPRLSPHSFQGMGSDGLDVLDKISKKYNLKTISEVVDKESLDKIDQVCDAIQIGTRNMNNYSLLKLVGQQTKNSKKPVLLKRGMSAKISELLTVCEYIKEAGNTNIILCERGIRTFEDSTRFTLDISAVPFLHSQCDYNVCVDLSHSTGNSNLIPDLALSAIAAGADSIMIEIHPDPINAKCDGLQQLDLGQFSNLISTMSDLAQYFGKRLI